MELRHLRRFLALAEELNFSRAAERLHIEQPPLSRTITELEQDLGVKLFDRTRRGTRLTDAGQKFLEDVPRVFAILEQTICNTKAAAQGHHRTLRIAVSDPLPPTPFATFLAHCREEEPEITIQVHETTIHQLVRGLRDNIYDLGFTRSTVTGNDFIVNPTWEESMFLAIPARHPLLDHKEVPLSSITGSRLIILDENVHQGTFAQIEQVLNTLNYPATTGARVASMDLMMTLVSAGYGTAIIGESHANAYKLDGVVMRPIAAPCPTLHSYFLYPIHTHVDSLNNLIERLIASQIQLTPPT